MRSSTKFLLLFVSLTFSASLVLLHHLEASAEPVEITKKWICETGEGADAGITQVKKGAQVETTFTKAKKQSRKALRKNRKKLRSARRDGIRKLVKRFRRKVKRAKSLLQSINKCQAGELNPVIPDDDMMPDGNVPIIEPTIDPTIDPVIEPTVPAGDPEPEVQFRRLEVFSELDFFIDPSRGWNQYFGELVFTNVNSLSPRGFGVPSDLQRGARAACMNVWREAVVSGNAAVRIFTLRLETGIRVNLNPPAFWAPQFFPEGDGYWEAKGFNAESGAVVIAEPGFWDQFYNRRTVLRSTSVSYKGSNVALECWIAREARRNYP